MVFSVQEPVPAERQIREVHLLSTSQKHFRICPLLNIKEDEAREIVRYKRQGHFDCASAAFLYFGKGVVVKNEIWFS